MMIPQIISDLLGVRLRRILDAAELALTPQQFVRFRKIVLDEFGRQGLLQDLERELRNRDRHG